MIRSAAARHPRNPCFLRMRSIMTWPIHHSKRRCGLRSLSSRNRQRRPAGILPRCPAPLKRLAVSARIPTTRRTGGAAWAGDLSLSAWHACYRYPRAVPPRHRGRASRLSSVRQVTPPHLTSARSCRERQSTSTSSPRCAPSRSTTSERRALSSSTAGPQSSRSKRV